jgi:ABC-type multidrug transport system ATPase subunit
MNKMINKYLNDLDFYVSFELDEGFEETIKSRFRDEFCYASFSEGEKMRIDLALLFTWRTIAKMKNSANTNLLILDEIFDSSLDIAGTYDFMKILRAFHDSTNVFIISHKPDVLQDKFERILKVEKKQNFSVVTEESGI